MQKSIVTNKKLKVGHILSKNDLEIKLPGGGLPPYKIDFFIGKKLKKNIGLEEFVFEEDVD